MIEEKLGFWISGLGLRSWRGLEFERKWLKESSDSLINLAIDIQRAIAKNWLSHRWCISDQVERSIQTKRLTEEDWGIHLSGMAAQRPLSSWNQPLVRRKCPLRFSIIFLSTHIRLQLSFYFTTIRACTMLLIFLRLSTSIFGGFFLPLSNSWSPEPWFCYNGASKETIRWKWGKLIRLIIVINVSRTESCSLWSNLCL